MLDVALKLINEIDTAGFEAYLVGGFVRDYLLGISSSDIDVSTNATPKELKEIFPDGTIPIDDYGSVTVMRKNIRFEITTFRKELVYKDNRHPAQIKYIDDLYPDLIRRDFTVNAICMDKEGEIIDLVDGKKDLQQGIIRTIGNSNEKLQEDVLRILRAVRFATTLDFSLSVEVYQAITDNKAMLKSLSYERKREELDKIFTNQHTKKGIGLLIELGLDQELELPKLRDVHYTQSLIGIWAVLDALDIYPFSHNEKSLIINIQEALLVNNLDAYCLYKYGLYVNCVAGEIKHLSSKKITQAYNNLEIKSIRDIAVNGKEIMQVLNRGSGSYLRDIFHDLERQILYRKLANDKDVLLKYCVETYG